VTAKPPAHEAFLTTEEVLEYLQVNLRTVYRLIKSNAIPAVRVGRQWRFKKQDIDAWLEGRKGAGAQPARQGRRRLLLVDDDEGTRILLTKMLEQHYDVETAADGAGALETLRRDSTVDLMISDLNMPGMDGMALIRAVKGIRPELPVIIITGYSTETSAIDAVNLRVAGYLTKPLRDTQVLEAAARALGAPAA
jgi:excisionase family DNA binding protein